MSAEVPTPVEVDPRIVFAAERTLLAWIRTGLAIMALGFVVARFGMLVRELAVRPTTEHTNGTSSWIGMSLVAAGVLTNAWASVDHARTMATLRAGRPLSTARRGPMLLGIATAVGGLVLAAVLLATR